MVQPRAVKTPRDALANDDEFAFLFLAGGVKDVLVNAAGDAVAIRVGEIPQFVGAVRDESLNELAGGRKKSNARAWVQVMKGHTGKAGGGFIGNRSWNGQ